MKASVAAALAACAFALCAPVRAESSDAIARLLNSRAAGSPRGYARAAEEVARDAESGRPLQQFVLALVSRDPDAPPAARLASEVREWYFANARPRIRAMAEQKGNPLAWYLLSLDGNDLKALKRAADGGNVQALNALGTLTLTQTLSNPGVKTNEMSRLLAKSFGYFRRAAAEGDANGLYNAGMCHLNGYGTVRDPEEAYECFLAAAESGHPEAVNNIGGFFRDGIVVGRDLAAAAKWFKRSADMQNAYGELNYALALQRGEGVGRDAPRAVALLRHSASQGCAEAMNAYGMCLYLGDGVEKDEAAAVSWYRRAAAKGFAPAMDNLASCCELGVGGTPVDRQEALVWKIRARAARGERAAAEWLAQNGRADR